MDTTWLHPLKSSCKASVEHIHKCCQGPDTVTSLQIGHTHKRTLNRPTATKTVLTFTQNNGRLASAKTNPTSRWTCSLIQHHTVHTCNNVLQGQLKFIYTITGETSRVINYIITGSFTAETPMVFSDKIITVVLNV